MIRKHDAFSAKHWITHKKYICNYNVYNNDDEDIASDSVLSCFDWSFVLSHDVIFSYTITSNAKF